MGNFILSFAIVGYLCSVPSTSCPVTCQCRTTSRPSADCSYRELMHVPVGFPENLYQLTLSVNNIGELNRTSFTGILKLTSLWLTYNSITIVHPGTFKFMTSLINLDISHNQLNEFPWMDLSTLVDLELLNLNNNQLVTIPIGAFNNSRHLRSLKLSNNQLYSLPEGLFDPLASLSHVQLFRNSFHCSCSLAWLVDWIQGALVTIDRKGEITCLSPNDLKDISLDKVPDLRCRKPLEIMSDDPVWGNTLLLCKEVGELYTIEKDINEEKSHIDFKVVIKKVQNGSITVTPIKQGTTYFCQVSNYSTENNGEISVTLAHSQMSGWQVDPKEKFLLFLVSGKAWSITNSGTYIMAVPMLFWPTLFMVLWYKVS